VSDELVEMLNSKPVD
jgi:hypothetical protein